MTNKEVFEQYNTEQWVIEQNLCFLLQEYWEDYCVPRIKQVELEQYKIGTKMPENPVTFVKKFMQEETICSVEYAEKSKMDSLENNVVDIIDADFREVVEQDNSNDKEEDFDGFDNLVVTLPKFDV